jgi:hypothetical protein
MIGLGFFLMAGGGGGEMEKGEGVGRGVVERKVEKGYERG